MSPERERTDLLRDRALAKGLRAGKRLAWNEFCSLYGAPLFRFASTRVGGDEHAARDVAQEAMVAALESIGRYNPAQGSLWAWLCGIAVNKAREHARSMARDERLRERLAAEQAGEPHTPDTPSEDLLRVLVQLHPRHQEVLCLKYMEDLSVAEVAERLNLSDKAVESRLTRARDAFRRVAAGTEQLPNGRARHE